MNLVIRTYRACVIYQNFYWVPMIGGPPRPVHSSTVVEGCVEELYSLVGWGPETTFKYYRCQSIWSVVFMALDKLA